MNGMTGAPQRGWFARREPANGVAWGLFGVVAEAILLAGAALRLALVVASVAASRVLPVLHRRQDTAIGGS